MKISGARVAFGPGQADRRNVYIRGGRVSFAGDESGESLSLSGFLLLPGLINAHDHLEFNLFPKLGAGTYANAKAWASDIHRPFDSPVKEHLSLSKPTRLIWGGLKNLLSGVTTVAHHNPIEEPLLRADFPVNVVREFGWAHSLDFSPDLAERFQATPENWPFLLHAGEGVDDHAYSEIARLDSLGVLTDRTALVHAIGLDHPGLALVKARETGIVWCPSSNLAVYGRTVAPSVLVSGVKIALGTDSAMTAQADLIDEIGVARRTSGLNSAEIYEMVTTRAARLLRLRDGRGEIREGGVADLIAVPDRGQAPADALAEMAPQLVIVSGRIRLIEPQLLDRISRIDCPPPQSIRLEGRGHWLTDVDLPSLHKETERALGAEYRLAGKRIWQ